MSDLSAGEWVFVGFVGLVLLVSVVCNILVVVVVAATRKLRNPTNILICNLAISDLVLSSVVLPQNLHDISHSDNYHEGDFLCRVVYTCPLLCIMASIYSMVAISFDRTRTIVLNSDNKLSFRTASIQLTIIWLLALVLCIPTIYEYKEYVIKDSQENNGTVLVGCGSYGVSYTYSVINVIVVVLASYVIPLGIMMYNYGKILAFFRAKGMFGKGASERATVFQSLFKTRMKVVKMLILVAALFAVSWAPYFSLLVIEKVSGQSDTEYSQGPAHLIKIALSAFSAAYNFCLYIVYNNNFRKGIIALLRLDRRRSLCCYNAGRVTPSDIDSEFPQS